MLFSTWESDSSPHQHIMQSWFPKHTSAKQLNTFNGNLLHYRAEPSSRHVRMANNPRKSCCLSMLNKKLFTVREIMQPLTLPCLPLQSTCIQLSPGSCYGFKGAKLPFCVHFSWCPQMYPGAHFATWWCQLQVSGPGSPLPLGSNTFLSGYLSAHQWYLSNKSRSQSFSPWKSLFATVFAVFPTQSNRCCFTPRPELQKRLETFLLISAGVPLPIFWGSSEKERSLHLI